MPTRTRTWIALLRGVNVGGNNRLPMKELVSELEALGFVDVKTYIQSGNVVFSDVFRDRAPADGRPSLSAAEIATAMAASIKTKFGFHPGVMVLSKDELASAAKANPFPEAEEVRDGKALHLFFLASAPEKIESAALDAVKLPSERWKVVGSICYLHTPQGFGTSKLAAKVERCVGVPATARNWRTVCELLKLAGVHA